MSFRLRTTRFGGTPTPDPTPPPQLPFGFGSIATQVSQVRPTTVRRVTRPTRPTFRPTTRPRRPTKRVSKAVRFVRPIQRPIRRTTERSLLIPFQRAFAEEPRPPTQREIKREVRIAKISKAGRQQRPLPERKGLTIVTTPSPPRDSIQRTTFPVEVGKAARQFLGVPEERIATRGVQKIERKGIIQIRPPVSGGDILLPSGRIVSAEEAAAPKFGDPEAQRQIEREAGGVPFAFQSFVGGARQEFENIGAIAGVGTAREEVGSLAVDLPFAVAEKTFTKEAPEGGGFFGLGFDFQFDPEAGAKESGRIQERIGGRFAEDPARALGSIATIGLVEAGLFVATGGAGTLAKRGLIGVTKRVQATKARKAVELFAKEQPDAKRGVPQLIEPLGDGRFAILQGTEEISKRGVRVFSPAEAVVQRITRAGRVVESKIPLITGVTKKGTRGKLKGKTIKVIVDENKQAQVPLIIVDTKRRAIRNVVTGQIKKEDPETFFFNKNIPNRELFLSDPSLLSVRGVAQTQEILSLSQIKTTGLRAASGREFGITGKPTKEGLKRIIEAEKFGQISIAGRGVAVKTSDAFKLPRLIGTFAEKQQPLRRGRLPALGGAEIISGIRPAVAEGLPFRSAEIFSARTVGGRTLSEFLSPTERAIRAPTVRRPLRAPREPVDDFSRIFEGTPTTRAGQPRPITARPTPRPRTRVGEVIEEFRIAPQRVRPVRVPLATRVGIATILPTQLARVQRQRDDFSLFQDLAVGEQIRLGTGQRLVQPLDQIFDPIQRQVPAFGQPERPITTPFFPQDVGVVETPALGLVTTPTFDFGVPIPPPPTRLKIPPSSPLFPPIGGAGLLFPFGDERRKRIRKGRKSKLGRRLFDIAEEPFGEVAVGLGFFIEQKGSETIEEAIGTDADFTFDPITRQERQARARLGLTTKRKRKKGFKRKRR